MSDQVGITERIKDTEHFDKLFLALMVRRMNMKRPDFHDTEAMTRLINNIDKYVRTGNKMFLIEACNYAWQEFMTPAHPAAHFRPFNDQTDETNT